MNGASLSFLGDAVLSVQVRKHLVSHGITNPKRLQQNATRYVSAKSQAEFMKYILKQETLTEEEMRIYRRGLNYKNHSKAKNVDMKTYKIASGLESLWGYWYLENQLERLETMWNWFVEFKETQNE